MSTILHLTVVAVTLLATPVLPAADLPAGTPCAAVHDPVSVPRSWIRSAHDGIVTWRSPRGDEALTLATYAFARETPDEAVRRERLRALAAQGRELERRLAGPGLRLSPLESREDRPGLRVCFSGEDPAARRRVLSVTVANAGLVQTFYYESVGHAAAAFHGQVRALFAARGRLDPPLVRYVAPDAVAILPNKMPRPR